MAAPGDVMNSGMNDPVTKAVVDNIMGNLPTKKPLVRCDECDLTFTSQTVLDTHLQGARHAKQIRSKNIMASLEETKVSFTKAGETNGLKCDVCNVCLNSIQQLQTHLNGSRHKKKASQGGRYKKEDGPQDVPVKPAPKKKEPNNKPIIQYSCDLCNKFFNSSSQYDMHMMSKKHLDKERNANKPSGQKKRFFPYWKRAKSNNQYPTRIDNQYPTNRVEQYDLSNSFVHGGYTNMA